MIKTKTQNSNFVRVNFSADGLREVLAKEVNVSVNTVSRSSILNAANNIQTNTNINAKEPKSFLSLPEFRGIEYVGYIIEKERLNQDTGQWVRVQNYKIVGSRASKFLDTRVAYGQIYRYRIKSVAKYTTQKEVSSVQSFDNLTDINQLKQDSIAQNLSNNIQTLISAPENKLLSTKTSQGIVESTISVASDTLAKITNGTVLLEKVIPSDTTNLSDSRIDLQRQLNDTILRTNTGDQTVLTDEYYSTYYESQASKHWLIVKIEENTPPPVVSNWQLLPRTLENKILVMWLKPANDQRDIKFFSLYRRNAVGQEWVKIAENIPESQNLFEDTNVQFRTKYIYALTAIDVHGIESFLSSQYEAELNTNIIFEKRELPIKFVSGPGLRPDEIDKTIKKFSLRQPPLVAYKNVKITPKSTFEGTDRQFIVKITSLDTHETQQLTVTVNNILLEQ